MDRKTEGQLKGERKARNFRAAKGILFQLLFFLFFLLTFSLRWAQMNYGNIGFDEILFHLNMPLKGTSEELIYSYMRDAFVPALWGLAAEMLLRFFPAARLYQVVFSRPNRGGMYTIQIFPLRLPVSGWAAVFTVWLCLLVRSADDSFDFLLYIAHQFQTSELIEAEYVDPAEVRILFPEEKKNLICIYVESAETSAQDRESGGLMLDNYIPELTEIAEENVSFSQSDRIEGAAVAPSCSWTMAGLLAETAGVPLKIYDTGRNAMSEYQYFMPGVTSLGEILEKEGYHNYFMAGSDFSFGGRRNYFTQHGSYEIFDYDWAVREGKIPSDYYVWWGFEDQKLFSYAKEKLLEIAAEGQPFSFSLLTVDTHHPQGYVCDLCPNTYSNQYANVWACASVQISEFVQWLKEQEFYEDTVVYIAGDHCSMSTGFYGSNTKDDYVGQVKRKVYNAFLNSQAEPEREKNRKFTTMDLFPSILGSLGCSIEGNRLGLGTNLFSGEDTLAEKYGYEVLFSELEKRSLFYEEELMYP